MQALGGVVLSVAGSGSVVSFNCDLLELVNGVLYLPILQLIAYYRAVAKGLNPDRPTNLISVVQLAL